jgi:phosphohistidine phosphatase
MKTLLIMRHAKSSWSEPGMADFDRPLNGRGKRDAPRMGEFLLENSVVPELIISSTAARACATAETVAKHCGYKNKILFEKRFYLAQPDIYIEVLSWLESENPVMVIGHNPGLEQLIYELTGKCESMPTAAIAEVELSIDQWSEILSAEGKLKNFWKPKEI